MRSIFVPNGKNNIKNTYEETVEENNILVASLWEGYYYFLSVWKMVCFSYSTTESYGEIGLKN